MYPEKALFPDHPVAWWVDMYHKRMTRPDWLWLESIGIDPR